MGKRTNFKRRKHDCYDTPYDGIIPLLRHLPAGTRYVEPCAGKGDLIRHLKIHGMKCAAAFDLEPRATGIRKIDALSFDDSHCGYADMIITNPPWTRDLMHPMIDRFRNLRPCWLLFDSDWAYTKQARPFLPYCKKIVAVGRLRWIPGSKYDGLENASWYLFGKRRTQTIFYGQPEHH